MRIDEDGRKWPTVLRFERDGFQNQKIEGPLRKLHSG
jgi:hypothetical protein